VLRSALSKSGRNPPQRLLQVREVGPESDVNPCRGRHAPQSERGTSSRQVDFTTFTEVRQTGERSTPHHDHVQFNSS